MKLRRRIPSANALLAFEAAGRLGSFSRAARELGVTQPAVSHTIGRLEAQLGHKLFNRNGPNLTLTPDGERLSRITTKAFGAIDKVLEEIEERDTQRDTLILSISSALATHWLMPRLSTFRRHFPDVELEFRLLPGSVRGPVVDCDIGMRMIERTDASNPADWFAAERVIVVASPAYLEEYGTLEAPRRPHRLASLAGYWLDWTEFAARAGLRLDPGWERLSMSDYGVVVHAALSGEALALGWTSVISRLVLDRKLVIASNAAVDTNRGYHLLTPANQEPRPIVLEVRDWMMAEMRKEREQLSPHFG